MGSCHCSTNRGCKGGAGRAGHHNSAVGLQFRKLCQRSPQSFRHRNLGMCRSTVACNDVWGVPSVSSSCRDFSPRTQFCTEIREKNQNVGSDSVCVSFGLIARKLLFQWPASSRFCMTVWTSHVLGACRQAASLAIALYNV